MASRRTTLTVLLLLLLASGLAAVPTGAAQTAYSCEATGDTPSCSFDCPEGAHLRVYAEAPGFAGSVWGAATCGGADASCSAYGACDTLSPDSTAAATGGECRAEGSASFVYCEALAPEPEGSSCGADSPDYWVCGFTCTAGERLHVSAVTTGPNPSSEWPRLHAACGGVDVYCQNNQACEASSATVLYNDTGVCRAETVHVSGTCASAQAPPPPPPPRRKVAAAIPSLGVGPIGPQTVSTPSIGQLCAPAGLVCAGPVERREVATTPTTPDARTPKGRVEVDYTDVRAPQVEWTTVDPVHAPTPVPLTVCAFGCPVPAGVSDPVLGFDVHVSYGEHEVERRVEAPAA